MGRVFKYPRVPTTEFVQYDGTNAEDILAIARSGYGGEDHELVSATPTEMVLQRPGIAPFTIDLGGAMALDTSWYTAEMFDALWADEPGLPVTS